MIPYHHWLLPGGLVSVVAGQPASSEERQCDLLPALRVEKPGLTRWPESLDCLFPRPRLPHRLHGPMGLHLLLGLLIRGLNFQYSGVWGFLSTGVSAVSGNY